ncbi:vitellogenin receptor [Monomorium pharaonis]|uniref:vitellogenin receptor n=1 Tax=Monomorium pharaonis TaxID=307658 RepID=UPI001746CF10|nr:vitellogenin receptor [Monomorium pharaonis]
MIMRRLIMLLFICNLIYPCYLFSKKGSPFYCPHEFFQCDDGKCIPLENKCDGTINCNDGSDENECNIFITCSKNEFKCKNNLECIPLTKYCDTKKDCTDGSDEHEDCVQHVNCSGKFMCKDRRCIPEEWVCDDANDCFDGSDEWNCGINKTLTKRECKTENSHYWCANQRCIALNLVCNEKDDCGDGSDEGSGCAQSNCSSAGCHHQCQRTPKGPRCVCNPGYKLQNNNHTCDDIDECQIYGICDQKCVNFQGSYTCTCQMDYYLDDDKKTCKARAGEATLVFSTDTAIISMYVESKKYFPVATNLSHAVGVAVNGDYIYWSDIEQGNEVIVRNSLETKHEIIVTTGLSKISGIAVDWITENIYFTDEGFRRIGVCTNNSTYCTVLIKETDKPTGIALLPTNGKMYWSDWGSFPHIAVAGMDGKNNQVFVSEKLGWPKSVTIDYPNERLYWVDAKSKIIESIHLDGTDRRLVLHDIIQQPFSLAVFENKLYWSDWESNMIHSCNKFTGKDWHILTRSDNKLYSVHIDHSAIKPKFNNPCQHNMCSHLCLLNEKKRYTCACTLDKELNADGRTCQEVKKKQHLIIFQGRTLIDYYHELIGKPKMVNFLPPKGLFITKIMSDPLSGQIIICSENWPETHIVRYDPTNNTTKEIITFNIVVQEVAFDYVGNNFYIINPLNQSIEVHSVKTQAMTAFYFNDIVPRYITLAPEESKMFVIVRNQRIYSLYEMQMNGLGERKLIKEGLNYINGLNMYYDRDSKTLFVSDISSGYILSHSAEDTRILRTGLHFPNSLTVAGDNIFWIEKYSVLYWTNFKSATTSNHKSVALHLPRKSSRDIGLYASQHQDQFVITLRKDNIQENGCQKNNGNCSHVCLPSFINSFICACPPGLELSIDNRTCILHNECLKNQYKCTEHNICIPNEQVCDGIMHCPNGEDETKNCAERGRCKENQFMCKNGDCISLKDHCNSHYDCIDQSDEDNCEKSKCNSDEFQCLFSKTCIPNIKRCNVHFDCEDFTDELNCKRECSPTEFTCNNGACIPKSLVCDGEIDCNNGEDEKCHSNTTLCESGQFQCASGGCITKSLKCDGTVDCYDGSDEKHCLENVNYLTNCTSNEYRCLNSNICVPKKVKCNGISDCPENDDEHGCSVCFHDEFVCDNKRCIPENWVCDKTNDCGDNSDEKNCDGSKKIVIEYGKCDEFRCSAGSCLPYSKVCDGILDCPDGSDENGKCLTACVMNNFCKGICYKTPTGGICGCQDGYRLATDMISCEDINECENHICSQICRNTIGSYECLCNNGYILRNDTVSCKAVGPPMEIVAVTDNDIRTISLNLRLVKVIHSLSGWSISGLDVNAVHNSVYWSNDEFGAVTKFNVKTKEILTVRIAHRPQTLAVDWITDNIYINDNDRPNTIKVCNLEKQKCATLIWLKDKIKVTSLVVDPINRWLFWSEVTFETDINTSSKICRTDMTGADMKIFDTDLGFVNGMAIDHINSRLYWSDYKNIMSSNFDGNQRKSFIHSAFHPLGLSIFEQTLYWLNSNGYLISCKLYGKISCETLDISTLNIHKFFTILHTSRQPIAKNLCDEKYCDYMCVLTKDGATCICSDGKRIESNVTCEIKSDLKFIKNINLSRNTRNISGGIYSITIIVLLVGVSLLCVYYYYQRNRLKSIPASDLSCSSIRFQNPSYDRSDEVEVMLDSVSPELYPGQHEYVNPINDKCIKAAMENSTQKSDKCLEEKDIEETEKQDALIYFIQNSK